MTTNCNNIKREALDYIELIKIGSKVKENLIRQTRLETTAFLLMTLRALVNEQVQADTLDKNVGTYLYDALKDQAARRRWI